LSSPGQRKERGIQAAKIMATREWESKPAQAIAKPPMVYNLISRIRSTGRQHSKSYSGGWSRRLEKNPKILAVSVPGGYQWATFRRWVERCRGD